MAFGRSNSLSLNTGAPNSMFSRGDAPSPMLQITYPSLNSAQNTSQPQQSGGLFGSSTNNTTQSGGLFGASTNNQTQQSGGLFGNNTNSNTQSQQPSGGLFGASTNNTAQPSGGLFGASTNNQSQPSGGLFGASTNTQTQPSGGLFGGQNNASTSGGLFGASTTNNATSQPQQSGGLFGNTSNQASQGGGLFGARPQAQPQQSGGLFGASTTGQTQGLGGSLFGNNAQTQNQNQSQAGAGGLFGGLGQNQNNNQQQINLGASTTRQPTLFGASLFNNASTSSAPLAGSLTMGQGQTQQQTVPGAKIDLSNLRPTTRFSDLHDDLKKTLESIDSFIKQQESYAAQCEALMPTHGDSVASLDPDVELVQGKVDTVELALENDSRDIQVAKGLVSSDVRDLARCIRVLENQQLPNQFHYGQTGGTARSLASAGDDDYDTDLVGYFTRHAEAMQSTLDTFTSNLSEIEGHLRVVESDTIQQSARISAQRAGGAGSAGQPNDPVRELADTLRGFEGGILQAAGSVGATREMFNELVMGKTGMGMNNPRGVVGRR